MIRALLWKPPTRAATRRSPIGLSVVLGLLLATMASVPGFNPAPAEAQVLQNSATANTNGIALTDSLATVRLNRIISPAPASLAEISPNIVQLLSTGVGFTLDLLPTIGPEDPSVDRISIAAPAGYGNLSVTDVEIGGSALTENCPNPGPGEYCYTISGETISLTLGTPLHTSLTNIRVLFRADAPTALGIADFRVGVVGAGGTQNSLAGDADGDPGDANNLTVEVMNFVDPGRSTVTVDPPLVDADGIAFSTVTTMLRDGFDQPVPGRTIVLSSNRGGLDNIGQPMGPTDANGVAVGTIRSRVAGVATITATNTTESLVIPMTPTVTFTQGISIRLEKTSARDRATIGGLVTYVVTLRNTTVDSLRNVRVEDRIPATFKFVDGSAAVDGRPIADPVGDRVLVFNVGELPALVDANGNGQADAGENGFSVLTYQLVVGSGARPGAYVNQAVAKDACPTCVISNVAEARVWVEESIVFGIGTVVGRVFEDLDRDGLQARGEPGVANAMVALDNGTFAITDGRGMYHFNAVLPGQRLIKLNTLSLGVPVESTTQESQILTVSPGLLATANFGVVTARDTVRVGSPAIAGLMIASEDEPAPVNIVGSVEKLALLVNGAMMPLPTNDVRISVEGFDEVVTLQGGKLDEPLQFHVEVPATDDPENWRLMVMDAVGDTVKVFAGSGVPPETIKWDGQVKDGSLLTAGEVYQYQMETSYASGSRSTSPRRAFGVDRATTISLRITGSAFESGSSRLADRAEKALHELAVVLRKFPDEKVTIEGHTDSLGSSRANLQLSKGRAEAAADYLVDREDIPRERIVLAWYGEKRPVTTNATPEGRELNRRVEVKGEAEEVERAKLVDYYRTAPKVTIAGAELDVDDRGRFRGQVSDDGSSNLEMAISDRNGRSVSTVVALPRLEIERPLGVVRLPYGVRGDGFEIGESLPGEAPPKIRLATHAANGSEDVVATYRLEGRTDPGNRIELDGNDLPPGEDGSFSTELGLRLGENTFGLVASNPEGISRYANLVVSVSDQEEDGRLVIAVEEIPPLTVHLPPEGARLTNSELVVTGSTHPDNQILINGDAIPVAGDGSFEYTLQLPGGETWIIVEARDPRGHVARVSRPVVVDSKQLFLLAFADGVVGNLQSKGYLDGSADAPAGGYYSEGRVAYYLKGYIAGKFLITSAFDSGNQEFRNIFDSLDNRGTDRLFTNLDPDRFYPVYGDSSTIVFDSQTLGRFYLAVESDEFHATVGNYPLTLGDTELAAFNRTLYGGRISYRSLAKTKYGDPSTSVTVLGADVRQIHIRDELRGTGGSIYYLSHKDVIEGSEQIALAVRDKNTGLVLSRTPLRPNADYSIKYLEGRILFHRPISSVVADAAPVDEGILSGNPVIIEIDYEVRTGALDNSTVGGRVQKQLGNHVGVGGSYVRDDRGVGRYELSGVDAQLRLGANTKLVGEVAKTSGVSSRVFASLDGGLSYAEAPVTGLIAGTAWKAAADLDIGEWFGSPNRARLSGYIKRIEPGFFSSGNLQDMASRRFGVNAKFNMTTADRVLLRYDRDDALDSLRTLPGLPKSNEIASMIWMRDKKTWGLSAELQGRRSADVTGRLLNRSAYGAGNFWLKLNEKMTGRLELQQTISGPTNNQVTLGMRYQLIKSLGLEAEGTHGTLGRSARGAAVLNVGGNSFYLREQIAEDRFGESSLATVFGAQAPIGASSRAYTEYQWERSGRGSRVSSVVGAEKFWMLRPGLRLALTGEHGQTSLASSGLRRTTLSSEVTFAHSSGVSATTRNEVRFESGGLDRMQFLTANHLEAQLHLGLSALVNYRYSITENRMTNAVEARFEERSLGLAFRPLGGSRLNALARYSLLSDRRAPTPAALFTTETAMNVASLEATVNINTFLQWAGKGAARFIRESAANTWSPRTHSYLWVSRMNVAVRRPLTMGVEYRVLSQREANDQRRGWLNELNWDAMKHVRFGVGYNFTDFSDNAFALNNYSVRGWFLRLQGKY